MVNIREKIVRIESGNDYSNYDFEDDKTFFYLIPKIEKLENGCFLCDPDASNEEDEEYFMTDESEL